MRIDIPLATGVLGMHFGHCEKFALIEVDLEAGKILGKEEVIAPPHEPGLLPPRLAERGVNLVIAGGLGQRAQGLFKEQNISVTVGTAAVKPEELVNQYLSGILKTGANVCDH